MNEKKFLSTTELAEILGISRIAVYKKVKNGQIKAIRIGKNYAIPVDDIAGEELTEEQKKLIKKAVDRTVKEYGEVLKMLGKKVNDEN
ncbi:helix-turn-helix domain-containing protein [Elusimicrobiota bacterium]